MFSREFCETFIWILRTPPVAASVLWKFPCRCVCVCVCVCVFILLHLLLSSGCTTSVTYIEVWINDLLLWVFLGALAKFHHLYFWICHISTPKTKTPADRLLERKLYDIMFALEKMIYIDIGYKSAHYKNRQWRKDTKDKEATLI